jgi:NADH:ubiquinone oxidoreductase subunit
MANIGTRLHTLLYGSLLGEDAFGNRYYQNKKNGRRWVLYKGVPEASKVPPEWHAWLHYTADVPLTQTPRQYWQKPHIPNLSGTRYAFRPLGHFLQGGHRAKATGDYQAWVPPSTKE